MIDAGVVALVAAGVALVVGIGGALLNRRTALDAQRAAERAKALVRVLHIVEPNGQGIQERIFNLTEARQENEGGSRRTRQVKGSFKRSLRSTRIPTAERSGCRSGTSAEARM